jgi:hypothetical protein
MASELIRVRWLATGHESNITEDRYREYKHERLDKPTHDDNGWEIGPKYRTNLAGEDAPREDPPTPVKKAARKRTTNRGQSADTSKES